MTQSLRRIYVPLTHYGLAVLLTTLALLLRLHLAPFLGDEAPLLVFFVPVVLSAWYGGFGPAVLAIALSVLAGAYFVLPPPFAFLADRSNLVEVSLFVLQALLLSGLTALIHARTWDLQRANAQLQHELTRRQQAEAALQQAHDELERRVVERTTQLVAEIRDRERAEAAQRFLTEAGRVLATSLDYETTLQQVAHLAVPFLADACVVGLVEADQSVRQLAVAPVDPATAQELRALLDHFVFGRQSAPLIQQVVQAGQPELIADLSTTLWATGGPDAEYLRRVQALGLQSAMIVPLTGRGRTLGVIVFARAEAGGHYGAADLALAEDLASRAALAIDNARLYRDAQQALVARDDFITFAAHELQGPLTPIAMTAALLQRWLRSTQRDPERELQAVQVLTEATQQLNQLIDLVSEVAGIQSGRFSLMYQPVDLVQLTQHVVTDVHPPPTHTIHFMSSEESLVIEGDVRRLERVLHNLLQNAIKYSPAGGPILVRVGRAADQATIAVSDQGIGIPSAALAHLFERFYRASNVAPLTTCGFGVGLYLVNEIVTRHGGRVEVRSVEGRGSTFTVRLPLAAPALK